MGTGILSGFLKTSRIAPRESHTLVTFRPLPFLKGASVS